jgi:transposase-like protein
MSAKQFSGAQIVAAMSLIENGADHKQVCEEMHIMRSTLRAWRRDYSGLNAYEIDAIAGLQSENRALRKQLSAAAKNRQILLSLVRVTNLAPDCNTG